MTVWCIHIASWITKATHTHILIFVAFQLQQWLQERALMLCCAFIACLIFSDQNLAWEVYETYSISYPLLGV